ncbi:MAG: hypothetical protein FWC20_00510 [Oscillospiraceae bacterium]|nr:hypothetical protein [Oscillospiraceae bacterium]MCL2277874.1 hypothetical protein [Oscillospiraceae bacterium]
MNLSKINLSKIGKILLHSVISIAVICVAALIYGRMAAGFFTLAYIFRANFLVGAIIVMIGLVIFMIPTRLTVHHKLKDNKLIDHSNYASFMMEKKEQKRKLAYEFIYLGICIIAIAALVQLLLSLII